MRVGIEAVEKQILDPRTAKFTRRQADVMNDYEFDARIRRTHIAVGRGHETRTLQQPF
jgi:hypothetical protein